MLAHCPHTHLSSESCPAGGANGLGPKGMMDKDLGLRSHPQSMTAGKSHHHAPGASPAPPSTQCLRVPELEGPPDSISSREPQHFGLLQTNIHCLTQRLVMSQAYHCFVIYDLIKTLKTIYYH